MRPPLAFDGASETAMATTPKSSPSTTRWRASSAAARARSSVPTLKPPGASGTAIRISRSVTVGSSANWSRLAL